MKSSQIEWPSVRRDLPQLRVEGHLIVGHEDTGGLILLDPVMALIFEALDGNASTEELTEDLTVLNGISAARAKWIIETFVAGLAAGGFLEGTATVGHPRRIFAPIRPESCLGARMGLSRAEIVQIVGVGQGFRIASTVHGIVGAMAAHFSIEPPDETSFYETIVLRASGSSRSTRAQRVLDSHGGMLYAGTSLDEAIEAFHRTVSGRVELTDGGCWLEGPVLERDGQAILVHPSLRDQIFRRGQVALSQEGYRCVPAGLNQLLDGGVLRIPPNDFEGEDSRHLRVSSMLTPLEDPRPAALKQLLHLCRHWDQTHFDQVSELGTTVAMVLAAPDDKPSAWLAALDKEALQ